MEPLIVWTDASLVEQGATADFYLDLECALKTDDDEDKSNTFSVQMPDDIRPEANSAIFMDGTSWGGLVQSRITDTSVEGMFAWEGRTWHGVLVDHAVIPPSGQAFFQVAGSASDCIGALISRLGVGALFAVGYCAPANVNYRFKRYVDGWQGLCDMLSSVGMKPTFQVSRTGGILKVLIGAAMKEMLEDVADGELATAEIKTNFLPYNHCVGLGKGELTERDIYHCFADSQGNISSSQTYTGLQERTTTYENSNAEHDDLIESTNKHLADLQSRGEVSVKLDEGTQADLGDYVVAYEPRVDARLTVPVTSQVLEIKEGTQKLTCEAGGVI